MNSLLRGFLGVGVVWGCFALSFGERRLTTAPSYQLTSRQTFLRVLARALATAHC